MYKAIIFDSYGTIISTGNGSIEATKEILLMNKRHDISPREFYADWKKYHREHIDMLSNFKNEESIFRKDLKRLYAEYGMDRDADTDVNIMLDTLGKRIAFPESKEVLDKLSEKFIVCIGSTSDTVPLLQDLKRNELAVNNIFTSEMLGYYKPQRQFYQSIIDELSISVSQALFVGDSLIDDVYGPQAMGMASCWVNRKNVKRNNDIVPDYEIDGLKKVMSLIE